MSSQCRYKFIRADFLIPVRKKTGPEERIADGYVLVEGDIIREVGAFTAAQGRRIVRLHGRELQVIGGKKGARRVEDLVRLPGAILPAFVKAHGHDHESAIIGVAKDVPLTVWLDRAVNMFAGYMNEKRKMLEKRFGCTPNYIAYIKARLDDIQYGIATNMVHHCNHNKYRVDEIVEANRRAGTKMIVAVGSQDRNYDPRIIDHPADAIRRLDEYHARFSGEPRLRIVPGPDQCFSNGPEILTRLKRWAREHGTLLHIHSSEEPNTTKWFRKTYRETPVEYFDRIGILDEKTVLAHQVNCTPNDLKLIRKRNAKVVHNPLANTILGSGMPPVIEMLKLGITVAISTDGSGSADNQNMLAAARLASQYQKALHQDASLLPAEQVLRMVTRVPADVLGFNTGSLVPGRDADVILIDTRRPNLTPSRLDNIVENIVWASDGSEVRYMMASGTLVKDNYRFTTLNEAKIKSDIQELAEMAFAYSRRAREIKGTGTHR